MDENSDIHSVAKLLGSKNVCPRCCLRFAGIIRSSAYSDLESVKKLLNEDYGKESLVKVSSDVEDVIPESKRHQPLQCAACLGLLQKDVNYIIEKIKGKVQEDNYKFSRFALSITIPVSIDLRQHLFHLYLKETLGMSYCLADYIPSVKDVLKWIVCLDLGKALNATYDMECDFRISVLFSYDGFLDDCAKLFAACPQAFPNRKKRWMLPEQIYTRNAILKAIESVSENIKNIYELPPTSPLHPCIHKSTTCSHASLYLGGRYNKYSRELSQTPWIINGVRKKETSVSELITEVVKQTIISDDIIFSSSGREDVDVRMLGNGRPFVLEIVNPRQYQWPDTDIKNIEERINSSSSDIAISSLQVVSKSDIHQLKDGEENKRKTYSAMCIIKKTLTSDDLEKLKNVKDLTLKQKTPIRVLHRRPLATREKIIHKIDGKILDSHQMQLEIETQAGTYVKEFVHGDFGRTVPNIGVLLDTEADIIELDVLSIHLDWPQSTEV